MPTPYIQRMVNLEPRDHKLVKQVAEEKGLGTRGFSAAIRMIIREWEQFTRHQRPTYRVGDPDPPGSSNSPFSLS